MATLFQWTARKANKFNARKIVDGNQTFDSKKEHSHWLELSLLEKAGEISNLQRQVKFELIPKQMKSDGKIERECSYIADFVYFDKKTGKKVVEDVKGLKIGSAYNVFVIKRKLMLFKYGIEVKGI